MSFLTFAFHKTMSKFCRICSLDKRETNMKTCPPLAFKALFLFRKKEDLRQRDIREGVILLAFQQNSWQEFLALCRAGATTTRALFCFASKQTPTVYLPMDCGKCSLVKFQPVLPTSQQGGVEELYGTYTGKTLNKLSLCTSRYGLCLWVNNWDRVIAGALIIQMTSFAIKNEIANWVRRSCKVISD